MYASSKVGMSVMRLRRPGTKLKRKRCND
ncbi:hypothetical protein THIOKS1820002 [Thiocapsa sp. KS1]|nr:hypothetical protein THIOKS1820002 [Thiocapsa sp. KS1]